MNGITERQENCVRVLSSKLGRPVPSGFEGWTRQRASECIEDLGKLVDGKGSFQDASQVQLGSGNGKGGLSRDAQVRLGLAAKLVHRRRPFATSVRQGGRCVSKNSPWWSVLLSANLIIWHGQIIVRLAEIHPHS